VICITHLAQVAAQGDQHIAVIKINEQNKTTVALHYLNREQRTSEIARMLGGINITPKTMAHAKEMLAQAR